MTAYTKFTIENFRCFAQKQKLKLAVPDEDKIGSGITYIVGPNNAGKTTLIEGMWFKGGDSINDSAKRSGPPKFQYFQGDNLIKTVELLRENASRFREPNNEENTNYRFEIISSRRHWDTHSGGNTPSSNIFESTVSTKPRNQSGVQVASILQNIANDDIDYKKFTKLVKQVLPEFHEWSVGFEDQSFIKYTSQDGVSHRSNFLGDGVISIIRILAHLFNKGSTGLIIDEPELSLHPLAQKKLIKVIAEYAQNRQIIIATHSPYFISWEYIKNGAVLNRVAKESETNSHIYSLGDYADYSKLIEGSNWQQPFLMDVVSKEIFFQDNILFVEGQEDVGLLQSQFADSDVNLYGYGVRGCGQFKLALKLAHDLGIKKACALLDKGDEEDKIKQFLEKEYQSSGYKVFQWNKEDIRDKEAYTSSAKEGYFNKKGELKSKTESDDFHEKIENIKTYFSQQNPSGQKP